MSLLVSIFEWEKWEWKFQDKYYYYFKAKKKCESLSPSSAAQIEPWMIYDYHNNVWLWLRIQREE